MVCSMLDSSSWFNLIKFCFVRSATVVRRFLDSTQSQLTYHGLFHLASTLPSNTPCALFRNSHLSVLYKHSPSASSSSHPSTASSPSQLQSTVSHSNNLPQADNTEDAALYTLVTDQVFLNEPSVVWERLEDVDGGWSTFVDSYFVRSSPAGGDFAGQTAEETLRAAEAAANENLGTVDPNEYVLFVFYIDKIYLSLSYPGIQQPRPC